jgi:hypothetical protein
MCGLWNGRVKVNKEYYEEWRWRLGTGIVGGSAGILADLIAHGGTQGLGAAAFATGALVFFVPQYREGLASKYRAARDFVEELPCILGLRSPDESAQSEESKVIRRVEEERHEEETSDEESEIIEGTAEPANWVNDLSGDRISLDRPDTGVFFFSELLKTGWRPSWNEIFVGRTMEDKNIFVPALDLCHVAFAGKTGGGKGSLMRLIMVQLCYIGAPVALLNPHYMRWVKAKEGDAFDEDWSPFEGIHPHVKDDKGENVPYLQKSPVDCAEMPVIGECLAWAATKLLESRKQRARTSEVNFIPYFIVIDEWPEILTELGRGMAAYLSKLLRGGRKYRIYVIIASQDFQVKTMGIDGEGGVRKCLPTVFYTGGDLTTRRELLNEVTRETPENKIGKGVVLMRCTGTQNEVVLARVPFVDNEAVYMLLGPTRFVRSQQEVHTDDLQLAKPDDEHSSLPTGANLGPNEQDIGNDEQSSSALPSDWTAKEAEMARAMWREHVEKGAILRLLGKKGTAAVRRNELNCILQLEEA